MAWFSITYVKAVQEKGEMKYFPKKQIVRARNPKKAWERIAALEKDFNGLSYDTITRI